MERYTVIPESDCAAHLTDLEVVILRSIVDKIRVRRAAHGKPALRCLVLEAEAPEYEMARLALQDRIAGTATNAVAYRWRSHPGEPFSAWLTKRAFVAQPRQFGKSNRQIELAYPSRTTNFEAENGTDPE